MELVYNTGLDNLLKITTTLIEQTLLHLLISFYVMYSLHFCFATGLEVFLYTL